MPDGILHSSVSLVGPGRAGRAFARSWVSAGGNLGEVVARDPLRAREAVRDIGSGSPRALDEPHASCEILVFAVPDDAITPAARELSGRLRCGAAFHLSGALPAAALDPLRSGGTVLGSLHPLRVFTGSSGETWKGSLVAVEGDPGAVDTGEKLVRAIGGRPRRIAPDAKPLYHAAATLAAGGTIGVVSLAARAWRQAGIPEEEARPALAELAARAAHAAASRGFEEAFTGPVARRDVGTVRAHEEALGVLPDAARLYALLAAETLLRTPGRGKEEEIRSLIARLRPEKSV
jgi:predicted short-subunit dehydrogenase-like oxidoreductase (DUF2520 family)